MPAGELAHFARKVAWSQPRNRDHISQTVPLADCDHTLQHDKHAWTGLARRVETCAAFEVPCDTEPEDPRDLRVGQHRKHLVTSRYDGRVVSHRESPGSRQRPGASPGRLASN